MISNKVSQIPSSLTLALGAKANAMKAEGLDVISCAVGEPDWDTLDVAKEAAKRAIDKGLTKYTPASGISEIKVVITQLTKEWYDIDYNPSQVTVTAGGKFTLFSALNTLLDPGDEVVIPAPYWVSYPPMVEMAGGKPVLVLGHECNGFKITAEALRKSLTAKTKIFLFNSPSNPTGQVYSQDEIQALAEVLVDYPRVVILSDDIYNQLVFDPGMLMAHFLKYCKGLLKDRVVSVNGASKAYSMTGWRIGWATGPQAVISGMSNYQSQALGCASSISQQAALAALQSAPADIAQKVDMLRERRDFVLRLVEAMPRVSACTPGGAFYLYLNIEACLGLKYRGDLIHGSEVFCEKLLKDQRVVMVPGVAFGLEGFVRTSFVVSKKDLQEGFRRLAEFTEGLAR